MERLVAPPEESEEDSDSDSDYESESESEETEEEADLIPLIFASRIGDTDSVKRLLEGGADVEQKDERGYTALWWSIQKRKCMVSEILLGAGAKLTTMSIDSNINEALSSACLFLNMPCVRACLDAGADVNYSQPVLRDTPLREALYSGGSGTAEIVRLLISKGADPTMVNAEGYNAFMWCAENGSAEIMEILLSVTSMRPPIKESRAAKMFQALWRGFQVRKKRRSCDLGAWKVRKFGSGFMYTFVFKRPTPIPKIQDEWFMSRMMTVV